MGTASTARTDSYGVLFQTKPTMYYNPYQNVVQQFMPLPNQIAQTETSPEIK
jgi:hypothetical protein